MHILFIVMRTKNCCMNSVYMIYMLIPINQATNSTKMTDKFFFCFEMTTKLSFDTFSKPQIFLSELYSIVCNFSILCVVEINHKATCLKLTRIALHFFHKYLLTLIFLHRLILLFTTSRNDKALSCQCHRGIKRKVYSCIRENIYRKFLSTSLLCIVRKTRFHNYPK